MSSLCAAFRYHSKGETYSSEFRFFDSWICMSCFMLHELHCRSHPWALFSFRLLFDILKYGPGRELCVRSYVSERICVSVRMSRQAMTAETHFCSAETKLSAFSPQLKIQHSVVRKEHSHLYFFLETLVRTFCLTHTALPFVPSKLFQVRKTSKAKNLQNYRS